MRVNIVGPEPLFRPNLPNGDVNPLWEYVTLATSRGLFVSAAIGGNARLDNVSADLVTPDLAAGILQLGGDIENYSRFFAADPTLEVPAGTPNAVSTDEEGNETPRTWADWHGPNHSHLEIDGTTYVSTHAWGTDLLLSEQKTLEGKGYVFKTVADIQALQAAAAPAEPE